MKKLSQREKRRLGWYAAEKSRERSKVTLWHITRLATSTFNPSMKRYLLPRKIPAVIVSRFSITCRGRRPLHHVARHKLASASVRDSSPGSGAKYANPARFITLACRCGVLLFSRVLSRTLKDHKLFFHLTKIRRPPSVFKDGPGVKSDNDVIYYHLSGWWRADCFWRSLTPRCIWNTI